MSQDRGNTSLNAQQIAQNILNKRGLFASCVAIVAQTLVLSLLFVGAAAWFDAPELLVAGPIIAFVCVLYLEVQARRHDRARLAPVRALCDELISMVQDPLVDWQMGFPYVRGKLHGKHVLCHFEGAEKGLNRSLLRVNLEVQAAPHPMFRLFGIEPEDVPLAFIDRLKKRWPERATLDGARLFSPEELGSNGPFQTSQALLDAVALCHRFSPYSAGLDGRGDGLLWDCRLTPDMTADEAIAILEALMRLAESLTSEEPNEPEDLKIQEESSAHQP